MKLFLLLLMIWCFLGIGFKLNSIEPESWLEGWGFVLSRLVIGITAAVFLFNY